jgi:hypothetical protein
MHRSGRSGIATRAGAPLVALVLAWSATGGAQSHPAAAQPTAGSAHPAAPAHPAAAAPAHPAAASSGHPAAAAPAHPAAAASSAHPATNGHPAASARHAVSRPVRGGRAHGLGTGVVEVATGGDHVCERRVDGTVVCREVVTQHEGTVHGLRDVVQLAMGPAMLCARSANGEVRCVDDEDIAHLIAPRPGHTPRPPTDTPGISGATHVVVGDAHACALLGDGTVRCWGNNVRGALGSTTVTHTTSNPVAVTGLTNVVELAAGGDRTCARTGHDRVFCWGERPVIGGDGGRAIERTPTEVEELSGAVQLAVGSEMACARMTDGRVRCWGTGPLGNGTSNPSPTPVLARGLTHVVEVAVGRAHACARTDRGAVRCWGANEHDQVARARRPRTVAAPAPVVAARGATQLSASADRTCARLATGRAACWGFFNPQDYGTGE